MTHPPKGTSLAPSWRCTASSGERRSVKGNRSSGAESELHQKVEVVALVEHLDLYFRVKLSQPPYLAVLLGHQTLVERRELDVEVVSRQVEVRAETLDGFAPGVPLDGELHRLVLPGHTVEVQETGELALGLMGETHAHVVSGTGAVGELPNRAQ